MKREIKIMRVEYPDIRIPQWQGRRLRGFFGAEQECGSLLHNHGSEGSIYRYPLVQYKVIGGIPTIIALEEGISAVYPLVMERETLILGGQTYHRGNMRFDLRKEPIGDSSKVRHYRFASPWFALNQANYKIYQAADREKRLDLLNRILIGNILSFSKGFGVTAETHLNVMSELEGRMTQFKNEYMLTFRGTFSVNYHLPDLIGLGKSISRGFGAIRAKK